MDKRAGNLILGGALLVGGIIGLFYSLRKTKDSGSAISKKIVIKVLKDLKNERYTLFKRISPLCKQEYESRKNQMSLEEFIASIFQEYQTQMNIEFARFEQRVLKRYKIKHNDYYEALNITYKDEEEIITLLEEIDSEFEQTLQGNFKPFAEKLPGFVTPEFMVDLWGKVKKRTLKEMHKAVIEKNLKEDSKEIDEIDRETQVEVYKEAGLCELDEGADKIVQSALYKYFREYPGFSEKINAIDKKSIEVLTLVFSGGNNIEEQIESI